MRPTLIAAVAVVLALVVAGSVQGQDPIQVLDIDTYERTVVPGETTTFNWTVRNADTIPYNVTIGVEVPARWTGSVTPSSIDGLGSNRAAPITVQVTAPDQVSEETVASAKVTFTAYLDGAIVFIASRVATITIPSIYADKLVLEFLPNPLPSPLDNEWGAFILDIVAWFLISVVVLLLLIPFLRKLGAMTKTRVAEVIIRIIRTPLVILLFLYGALQSLSALDRHVPTGIRDLLLNVYQLALTLSLIYLGYRLFKDVVVYLARAISQRTTTHLDDVVIPIVEKVGLAVIGIVGLGLILGFFNVDLTLFVAGGVVISMVLAFAAQDTLSNFFSGIFILADRPFRVGDIVILSDGDWAEVRKIGMRTTRLFRFSDASIVTIPNNQLVNEKVANFTNPQDKGRVMKTFNVAYGSDVTKVKEILREVVRGNPHIIQEEPLKPIVRFDAMSESSLDFFLLLWLDDRANRFDVQDYLNTEIYRQFNEAGIEIPFPQRTVHLRLEGGGGGLAPPEIERFATSIGRQNPIPREDAGNREEG